jgi:hypothetical protein
MKREHNETYQKLFKKREEEGMWGEGWLKG